MIKSTHVLAVTEMRRFLKEVTDFNLISKATDDMKHEFMKKKNRAPVYTTDIKPGW